MSRSPGGRGAGTGRLFSTAAGSAAAPRWSEAQAMHARTEMRRQRGFTLLEMLVALTVLGFLMVGLNEGVRTGLGMWSREARQIGSIAELDSTARILRSLLGGIPLAPAVPADPTGSSHVIAFAGTADRLVFVGDMPTGVGTTRLADITLALRGEQLGSNPGRHVAHKNE